MARYYARTHASMKRGRVWLHRDWAGGGSQKASIARTDESGPLASSEVKLNVSTPIVPPTRRPGPTPSGTPPSQSLYAHSRWEELRPWGRCQSGLGLAEMER